MNRFPIGFHIGPGGNASDLGTGFMRPLDEAGIAFFIKSADVYPQEAVEIARASGVPHTIVWRKVTDSTYDYDVPPYHKSPEEAALEHFRKTLAALPPEFDREIVWLEPINEVDKGASEWLASFSISYFELARMEGLKIAMFGWSSGEPEPEHWRAPAMLNFLRLAAANQNTLAVALHEYSYSLDIYRWYPYLVGRYKDLHDACDENGIGRPTIMITEWGWHRDRVPSPGVAVEQIDSVAKEYVQHRNMLGAGLWYLGGGYSGEDGPIANAAQKLILPVGQLALGWEHYLDDEGEPPVTDCIETKVFTRHHLLRPNYMTDRQWAYLRDVMENGLFLPDGRKVFVGYEGWSHLDALGNIKQAVDLGMKDSSLIIMDGHLIGTGLDSAWMAENCPGLLPYTVWVSSGESPSDPFSFEAWPTEYRYVTQEFAENPENYNGFCDTNGLCLPGHDGVDIRAPEGSPIYAVADGTVYRIENNPSASNYGIHVRIKHRDGYKTIYAHLSSVVGGLYVGDRVIAGQWIGSSGNTGNSFGAHLHLGLKLDGHTYIDESGQEWPWNLHNPEPFLKELCPSCFGDKPVIGSTLLGLHASADPGLASGEVDAFKTARIELVKVLSSLPGEDVSRLASALPGVPFIIRAFLSFGGRVVSPSEFFEWTVTDVRRAVDRLKDREVIIELHNEPNIADEGMWLTWQNGYEFSNWLFELSSMYSEAFPGIKLAYPGLSPGGDSYLRYDSRRFLSESIDAARGAVDMVALHTYWSSVYPMSKALAVVDEYVSLFGNAKPLVVTEASNNTRETDAIGKGLEYVTFVSELKKRPNVYGVSYFVASASRAEWGWDSGSGEVWVGTDIPSTVGASLTR